MLVSPWLVLWPLVAQSAPLSLPEAIRRSWEHHPALVAAQAMTRAAGAATEQTRAARRPRADFAESFTRSNQPVFVFGSLLTQRQFTAGNFALGALNQPDFLNNFQSLLRAEQVLWDAGRARRATEAAALQQRRAAAVEQEVRLGLAARTARAYLDVQLAEAALPSAEQAIRSAEASLEQARAIRDAGRSTGLDALAIEAHLEHMRDVALARRTQVRVARAELNELIGLALDEAPALTSTGQPVTAAAAAPALARPEQELARLDATAARQQTEIARAAWMPVVKASAAFEADRQRFVTRGGSNWTAGATLQWNLFDGGARVAATRVAVEQERAAQARGAAVERQIEREVFQARALLEAAAGRVESARRGSAAAAEGLRIARDRYGAGLVTVTELLRAEAAALDAEFLVVRARHEARLAGVNLAVAQGQLTGEELP